MRNYVCMCVFVCGVCMSKTYCFAMALLPVPSLNYSKYIFADRIVICQAATYRAHNLYTSHYTHTHARAHVLNRLQ